MANYDYTTPPVGEQFNRLTVLNYSHSRKVGTTRIHYWICLCSCGTERTIRARDVEQGRTKSCGCLQRENVGKRWRKHGACGTPEYAAWQNMKSRCLNEKNREYPNYGGRGIAICAGMLIFEKFLSTVKERSSSLLSLDREDNDAHYSCGDCPQCLREGWANNVRWTTTQEQNENRRVTRLLTFQDRTMSISAWAREIGMHDSAIQHRLDNMHWSVERTLSTPSQRAVILRE